jgi:hypothetical protein
VTKWPPKSPTATPQRASSVVCGVVGTAAAAASAIHRHQHSTGLLQNAKSARIRATGMCTAAMPAVLLPGCAAAAQLRAEK